MEEEFSKIDKLIEDNEKSHTQVNTPISSTIGSTTGTTGTSINRDEIIELNGTELYCSGCKKKKAPEEFGLKKDGKDFYKKCIECRNKSNKKATNNSVSNTSFNTSMNILAPNTSNNSVPLIPNITKTLPNIAQVQDIAAKTVKELNKIESTDIEKMKDVILKYDKSMTRDKLDIMKDIQIIELRDKIATEQISIALSAGPEEILFQGIKMIGGILECIPQLKEKDIDLTGFVDSIERNKTSNIALLKKVCERSPMLLAKLTPEAQLGISLGGSALSVIAQNKFKKVAALAKGV